MDPAPFPAAVVEVLRAAGAPLDTWAIRRELVARRVEIPASYDGLRGRLNALTAAETIAVASAGARRPGRRTTYALRVTP